MGYMLMAFGVGLIPFSVQYVVLRAFYAYEDTRTPFYNTVIVAAVNAAASALCFLVLPARWAVVGMAASYGLAYMIGVGVAWRRLSKRMGGDLDSARVVRTYARLAGASIPATIIAGAAVYGIMQALGNGVLGSLAALVGGGRSSGGLLRRCAKDADRRADRPGRHGPRQARALTSTTIDRHRVSCIVADCGHNCLGSLSLQRMGRQERRWRNGARLPSTWPTRAVRNR